jgi:SAM-dependent methyltransferase
MPELQCPLCSNTVLLEEPFYYLFHERELCGYRCLRCGIIFLNPQPSAKELVELYGSEYFEGGDFRCGHEGCYCDPATLNHVSDRGMLDEIRRWKTSGRFLEIGCAGGAFLNIVQEAGFAAEGVELSEAAARIAQEKFGLKVFVGDVLSAAFESGRFDVIYMGDVIEHLPDPLKTIGELHRILAEKGLLVLALPSQTNTLFSRLGFAAYRRMHRRAMVSMPPYHLFEYRPCSLRYLLKSCGLNVVQLKQGLIPPSEINLRGSMVQRWGKKIFQYPNWLLTHTFSSCGDRITAFATKDQLSTAVK